MSSAVRWSRRHEREARSDRRIGAGAVPEQAAAVEVEDVRAEHDDAIAAARGTSPPGSATARARGCGRPGARSPSFVPKMRRRPPRREPCSRRTTAGSGMPARRAAPAVDDRPRVSRTSRRPRRPPASARRARDAQRGEPSARLQPDVHAVSRSRRCPAPRAGRPVVGAGAPQRARPAQRSVGERERERQLTLVTLQLSAPVATTRPGRSRAGGPRRSARSCRSGPRRSRGRTRRGAPAPRPLPVRARPRPQGPRSRRGRPPRGDG